QNVGQEREEEVYTYTYPQDDSHTNTVVSQFSSETQTKNSFMLSNMNWPSPHGSEISALTTTTVAVTTPIQTAAVINNINNSNNDHNTLMTNHILNQGQLNPFSYSD